MIGNWVNWEIWECCDHSPAAGYLVGSVNPSSAEVTQPCGPLHYFALHGKLLMAENSCQKASFPVYGEGCLSLNFGYRQKRTFESVRELVRLVAKAN